MKKFLLYIAAIVILFGCTKESPLENKTIHQSIVSYYLYVGNDEGNDIFIIDTDNNTVVDTIRGFSNGVTGFVVTSSGKKMYVSKSEILGNNYTRYVTPRLYSVDLPSKRINILQEKSSDVYLTPRGEVLVITHDHDLGYIGLIDTLTDVITFFDTINIRDDSRKNLQGVAFNRIYPVLYGISKDSTLFAYDYNLREVVYEYKSIKAHNFKHMIVSPDNKHIYIAEGPVLNLERDTIVGLIEGPVTGWLALSLDGKQIYLTDIWPFIGHDFFPSGKVYILNTGSDPEIIGEIDITPLSTNGPPPTYDIVILPPDGKVAYVSGGLSSIYVIDVMERKPLKRIGLSRITFPLAIGKKF
ncbi:MAG: hypothetical protein QME52_09530 [Bacteroidota bacterium]|nr:hypothetical protein [Bacteroidota bacterium]